MRGRIKIAPQPEGMTMTRIASWLAILIVSLAAGAAGALVWTGHASSYGSFVAALSVVAPSAPASTQQAVGP